MQGNQRRAAGMQHCAEVKKCMWFDPTAKKSEKVSVQKSKLFERNTNLHKNIALNARPSP
jgi:hypothetical protein